MRVTVIAVRDFLASLHKIILFDDGPFVQVFSRSKRSIPFGAYPGLWIMKQWWEMLNGMLTVQSIKSPSPLPRHSVRLPGQFSGTHQYSSAERGTAWVKTGQDLQPRPLKVNPFRLLQNFILLLWGFKNTHSYSVVKWNTVRIKKLIKWNWWHL